MLPDVPTMAEAGLPEMQGSPWFGLVVAAETPRPIIDWINREATQAFTAKDVRDRFTRKASSCRWDRPKRSPRTSPRNTSAGAR